MKSSTKDKTEGRIHQVKGKLKEAGGILSGNRNLEAEGKKEKAKGNVQDKAGQVKRVLDK